MFCILRDTRGKCFEDYNADHTMCMRQSGGGEKKIEIITIINLRLVMMVCHDLQAVEVRIQVN